jgi:hypothetical protein
VITSPSELAPLRQIELLLLFERDKERWNPCDGLERTNRDSAAESGGTDSPRSTEK